MRRDRRRPLAVTRALLVLIGLLLLAAAVAGGLLATGAVGRITSYTDADGPLLTDRARDLLADHTGAFQAGGAVAALAAIVVGLLWLRQLVPARRQRDDLDLDLAPVLPADGGPRGSGSPAPASAAPVPGYTRVAGAALVEALEDDLVARAEGLHGARADYRRRAGRGEPDELRLRLDVDPSCPLADLLTGPVAAAVDRFATVAGLDPRPIVITDIRLAAPAPRPRVV